jgi:hypothetical protein
MKKLLLIALLIVGCGNNPTESSYEDIIGNWVGTEINNEELSINMNFSSTSLFYFSYINQDTLETMEADYFINQNIFPKQIDVFVKSSYINQELQNSYIGLTSLGIYQIYLDTLTFAASEPGTIKRPINFEQGHNEDNDYYARVFKLFKAESNSDQ